MLFNLTMELFVLFLIFLFFAWDSLPRKGKIPTSFSNKVKEIFGADIRSLALYRIFLGLLLLLETIHRASDMKAFYVDSGLVPRALSFQYSNLWNLSFHMLSGREEFQAFLFLLQGLFALFLILGFRTKFSTFISWVLLISVQNRNQIIIDAGDYLLRLILFWSLFLPLGARYSIDKAFSKSSEDQEKIVYSIGTLGFFLQIAFMYWFSVILKLNNTEWANGTALYYVLNLIIHTNPIGYEFLKLPLEVLKFLTYSILRFEEFGPLFLFTPFYTGPIRTLAVFCFFVMHLGFGLCLDLENFPWISTIAMLPFIPSWFWDFLLPRVVEFLSNKINFLNSGNLIMNKLMNQIVLKNHEFWSSVTAVIPPSLPSVVTTRFSNLFASLCLVCVFSINLASVNTNFKFPDKLGWFMQLLRIDQRWGMFIAVPSIGWYSGWFVFPGKLKNGDEVDIFNDGKPVSWDMPKLPSVIYKNHHWKRYFVNVFTDGNYFSNIAYFGFYKCNEWNNTHPDDKHLEEIVFYFMRDDVLPDYKKAEPKKMLWARHKCGGESGSVEEIIKDIEERFKENESLVYWEILRVATSYFNQGKYSDAEELYKKVVEIQEKTPSVNNQTLIQNLEYLSLVYLNQGKLDEAKKIERKIQSILTGKPIVGEEELKDGCSKSEGSTCGD